VMMHHPNSWNEKCKNKEKQLKPMVVERGKTCSRSKENYNFNRVVGK
jgi:hypothetical protein